MKNYINCMDLLILLNQFEISKLRWVGHVERLDKEEIINRIMEIGRWKLRGIDGVMKDERRMRMKR